MKQTLREYLQTAHDAIVWKLDGLSEYDVRRPVVPDGHQPPGAREAPDLRRARLLRPGLRPADG